MKHRRYGLKDKKTLNQKAKEIRIHECYENEGRFDIALVKLKRTVLVEKILDTSDNLRVDRPVKSVRAVWSRGCIFD